MDKRILKSEHAIKTAFLRLCRNKDPHRISVVDLCKEAKINRSTFYERYGYIDNLIYDILLNEVKNFQNTGVFSMVLKWMKDQMPVSIDEMAEIIYQFSKAMFLDYKKGNILFPALNLLI